MWLPVEHFLCTVCPLLDVFFSSFLCNICYKSLLGVCRAYLAQQQCQKLRFALTITFGVAGFISLLIVYFVCIHVCVLAYLATPSTPPVNLCLMVFMLFSRGFITAAGAGTTPARVVTCVSAYLTPNSRRCPDSEKMVVGRTEQLFVVTGFTHRSGGKLSSGKLFGGGYRRSKTLVYVSRASRIFPRMRMRVRKWGGGREGKIRLGRPARFSWLQLKILCQPIRLQQCVNCT